MTILASFLSMSLTWVMCSGSALPCNPELISYGLHVFRLGSVHANDFL